MRHFLPLPIAFSLLMSGCHFFSPVRLENVATASGKPSNVAALVSVTKKNEPVTSLGVADFRIVEDGQVLDREQSSLKLLDPVTVATFHTVLLLDLGHATNDERKRQLSKAAASFVRKVRQRQPVTVLVYDGSARTRLVGEFSVEPSGTGPELLDNLLMMVPSDTSRNLRGAVVQGLDTLDGHLAKSTRPVRVGTMVVFSRGPDVAGRVAEADFNGRVENTTHQLVYIDVSGDPTDKSTTLLAKSSRIDAQAPDTLPIAFEEAGMVASHLTAQYYLLSYCSPARAGMRRLKVEVTVPGTGNEVETDSFETSFDATDFSPGCNSGNPPRFVSLKKESIDGAAGNQPKASSVTSSPSKADPAATDASAPKEPDGSDLEVPPPNKPGYAP